MFLFKQTWIPSPWNFTCQNKTRTQIFVIQVAALGTNLISHLWRTMKQERGTPRSLPCQEPPGFITSRTRPPLPSQVGCLAKRTHVEVAGAAEALHSPGGLWQPPRRALMDEDPVGILNTARPWSSSKSWEQRIWEYTHRLY